MNVEYKILIPLYEAVSFSNEIENEQRNMICRSITLLKVLNAEW